MMTKPSWVGSPETTPLQKQIYNILSEGGTRFHRACRIAEEIEAGTLRGAAMPDLLAALEAMLNWLEHARVSGALRRANGYEPIIEQARAAIAAARGAEGAS